MLHAATLSRLLDRFCSSSVDFFLLDVPSGCDDAVAACACRLVLACIATRTRFVFLTSLTAPVWKNKTIGNIREDPEIFDQEFDNCAFGKYGV